MSLAQERDNRPMDAESGPARKTSDSVAAAVVLVPVFLLAVGAEVIRGALREPRAYVGGLVVATATLVVQGLSLQKPGLPAAAATLFQMVAVAPLLPAACLMQMQYDSGCVRTEWAEGLVVGLGGLLMLAMPIALIASGAKFLSASAEQASKRLFLHLIVAVLALYSLMGVIVLAVWDTCG